MIQNARSLMHEPPVVYSLAIPMGSVQSFWSWKWYYIN
jgi:hypothetical protein